VSTSPSIGRQAIWCLTRRGQNHHYCLDFMVAGGAKAWRDTAREWVEAHRQVLEQVLQHFLRTAEWPDIRELQRELDRSGVDAEVEDIASSKPTSIGITGTFGPSELTLQIRHLMHMPNASSLVTVCMNAVKLAEERYLDFDEQPRITSDDSITAFPSDASGGLRLRAFKILTIDRPSPFGGSSRRDGDWSLEVDSRSARKFRDIRTAAAFVERQDELVAQPPPANPAEDSSLGVSEDQEDTLFLSWSGTRSNEIASRMVPILEVRLPGVEVFFSPESIDPGADPSRKLYEESLIPAKVLLVILTPESATSAYVIWETAAAWGREQLVIPVFAGLEPDTIPGPLTTKLEGVFLDNRPRMDRAIALVCQEFGIPDVSALTDEEWAVLQAQ
jgi:hypothetical protein